jgi:hypothetical protein
MITHEEKMMMRENIYRHAMMLMEKVKKMFDSGELTPAQMDFAGDLMKDIAKADKSLSAACYYDSQRGSDSDKKY